MAEQFTPAMVETARLIESRMARARLTRRELAEVSGIPFATLDRKLSAAQEFTFAELHLIAACLGTTPSAFIPADQP